MNFLNDLGQKILNRDWKVDRMKVGRDFMGDIKQLDLTLLGRGR